MDTLPVVSPTSSDLAVLAELIVTPNLLFAGKVHLYQNNINPSKITTLADFVEATFTGYLAVSWGTWGTPYVGIDGLAHTTAPSIQFQATDAVTPNTIYGAYLTNTAGTVLVASAAFVTPIPIPDATAAVIYEPDYIYAA